MVLSLLRPVDSCVQWSESKLFAESVRPSLQFVGRAGVGSDTVPGRVPQWQRFIPIVFPRRNMPRLLKEQKANENGNVDTV